MGEGGVPQQPPPGLVVRESRGDPVGELTDASPRLGRRAPPGSDLALGSVRLASANGKPHVMAWVGSNWTIREQNLAAGCLFISATEL
jgi:hypothetical protein